MAPGQFLKLNTGPKQRCVHQHYSGWPGPELKNCKCQIAPSACSSHSAIQDRGFYWHLYMLLLRQWAIIITTSSEAAQQWHSFPMDRRKSQQAAVEGSTFQCIGRFHSVHTKTDGQIWLWHAVQINKWWQVPSVQNLLNQWIYTTSGHCFYGCQATCNKDTARQLSNHSLMKYW